jgi:chromate reductase, NAD(P)H dehydrogenase (quinone)
MKHSSYRRVGGHARCQIYERSFSRPDIEFPGDAPAWPRGGHHLDPVRDPANGPEISDLPLYNQDDDANQAPAVKRLKSDIAAADGLLFVTPEYNRSIPGVLKNAIDHASRPYGQSACAGKPAAVIGISVGAIGTALAPQHLRNILAYLDVPTLGQPEAFIQTKYGLFETDGSIGASSRQFLQSWMDRYIGWVSKHVR